MREYGLRMIISYVLEESIQFVHISVCLDQTDTQFVEQCQKLGIDYCNENDVPMTEIWEFD